MSTDDDDNDGSETNITGSSYDDGSSPPRREITTINALDTLEKSRTEIDESIFPPSVIKFEARCKEFSKDLSDFEERLNERIRIVDDLIKKFEEKIDVAFPKEEKEQQQQKEENNKDEQQQIQQREVRQENSFDIWNDNSGDEKGGEEEDNEDGEEKVDKEEEKGEKNGVDDDVKGKEIASKEIGNINGDNRSSVSSISDIDQEIEKANKVAIDNIEHVYKRESTSHNFDVENDSFGSSIFTNESQAYANIIISPND